MITKQIMESLFPTKGFDPKKHNLVRFRSELIDALNYFLPRYGINTYPRVRAFLACCGVETAYFRTTVEYASGADYEGRKDLGNVIKGDGKRYRGRSVIQTTGRYNVWRVVVRFVKKLTGKDFSKDEHKYRDFAAYIASKDYENLLKEADRLNVNFLANPELLAGVRTAVEAACIFWQENNLNFYADRGEFKQLNGVVNRGNPKKTPLHWSERNQLYSKCGDVLPEDFAFEAAGENSDPNYKPLPIVSSSEPLLDPEQQQAANDAVDHAAAFGFDLTNAPVNFDKASATLQNPSVKTVATRAGTRLAVGFTTVWGTTGGKIAITLTALIVLGVLAGVIYSYRKKIQLGYQIAKASILKTLKLKGEGGAQ